MKKIIIVGLITLSIGFGTGIIAMAAPNYGSNVSKNSTNTTGLAWTGESYKICRVKMVVGSQVSDITKDGWAQTRTIIENGKRSVYINHYVNHKLIHSVVK